MAQFKVTYEDVEFTINGEKVQSRTYYLHVGDEVLKFKLVEGQLAKNILNRVLEVEEKKA